MRRGLAAAAAFGLTFGSTPCFAQKPAAGAEQQSAQSTIVRLAHHFLTESDDAGVPPFTVSFGGIKPGSSIALGPAVGFNFSRGSFVQATAEYSVNNFKLLQLRYRSPAYLGKKLVLMSRVRWQDAPEIPLFPLGINSPMKSAEYGETRTELSVSATIKPKPRWTITTGTALEHYRTTAGTITTEDESLPAVPDVPGLDARPSFVHSFGGLAYDTRRSPDYSTRGWMMGGAVHEYHDTQTGGFSFSAGEGMGDLLLPGIGDRGTFDFIAHAWTTRAADGATVPVFLMPYLGVGDYLRGYRLYRFRDRNALLLTVEHRWAVHDYVDVVGFADGGTVAHKAADLLRNGMRAAYGAGVLAHTPKSTLIRVDLARSSEGFQLNVTFSSATSGSV